MHVTCINYILNIWFHESEEDDDNDNKDIVVGEANGPLQILFT